MAVFALTQADNGESLFVKGGDIVNVSIPENPTTGYRWAVDTVDASVLRLLNSTFSTSSGLAIGGGGTRTMTFQAVGPGSTSINLKLWREWLGDASIIGRFGADIRVQQ